MTCSIEYTVREKESVYVSVSCRVLTQKVSGTVVLGHIEEAVDRNNETQRVCPENNTCWACPTMGSTYFNGESDSNDNIRYRAGAKGAGVLSDTVYTAARRTRVWSGNPRML